MLRGRPRARYVLILYEGKDTSALESLSKRYTELFGHVSLAKARLQLMKSSAETGLIIIRCNLAQIHTLLVSIALTDPPMLVLDMSGTVRRLRARPHDFPLGY